MDWFSKFRSIWFSISIHWFFEISIDLISNFDPLIFRNFDPLIFRNFDLAVYILLYWKLLFRNFDRSCCIYTIILETAVDQWAADNVRIENKIKSLDVCASNRSTLVSSRALSWALTSLIVFCYFDFRPMSCR